MAGKHQVFLSHASNDAEQVKEICRHLEQQGFGCWQAPRDIDGGDNWPPAILEAIDKCRVMIVFVTVNANSSENVENEVLQALAAKKRVIPVRLEDIELSRTLTFHLRTRQVIDVIGEDARGLQALSNTLDRALRRRTTTAKSNRPSSKQQERSERLQPRASKCFSTTAPTCINPYEFNTPADSQTFKGRQAELDELVDSIKTGGHTAIFGLQRMGKTSLVEERLRSVIDVDPNLRGQVLLASVDFQRLGDDEVTYRDLLHAIVESIVEEASASRLVKSDANLRLLTNQFFSGRGYQMTHAEMFSRFVKILKGFSKTLNRRIVLFIDEFSETRKVIERAKAIKIHGARRSRGGAPHDEYIDVRFMHHVSGILKDHDIKEHFTLIVAVRPFMAEFDQKEDLQILKLMKPVSLYYLNREAAEALVTQPLAGQIDFDSESVDILCDTTAGHPYLLQFVLNKLVSEAFRKNRRIIDATCVARVFKEMVSDGPAYDAQFDLLVSDYSVDEVRHEAEADLGKGMLAIIAKSGESEPDRWVSMDTIVNEFVNRGGPEGKAYDLLSQLLRVRIIDECEKEGELWFRITVPLLGERFLKQNLYYKYFRSQATSGRR